MILRVALHNSSIMFNANVHQEKFTEHIKRKRRGCGEKLIVWVKNIVPKIWIKVSSWRELHVDSCQAMRWTVAQYFTVRFVTTSFSDITEETMPSRLSTVMFHVKFTKC